MTNQKWQPIANPPKRKRPPFMAASTLQANPADAVMQYAVELLRRNPLRTGEKGG